MPAVSTLFFMGALFVISAALYALLPEEGEAIHPRTSGPSSHATPERRLSSQALPYREREPRRILWAAEHAKLQPSDRVDTFLRSIEVVYRLINERLPDYADKISAVGYDERITGVRTQSIDKHSLLVMVGKDFIAGTNAASLKQRADEIEHAVLSRER